MPSFISAAVAALSLSSLASANVAYRRQEAFSNSSSSSTQLSTSSSRSVPLGTGSSSIITTSSSTAGAGAGSGSGSGNSSATATTGSVSSTTGAAPASSTSATTFNGVSFLIEFDITYQGVSIDLEIVLAKRAGNSLQDCLATCAANTQCVATAYNTNTTSCTFFSSFDKNTRESAPGIDFAQVTGRANNGTSNSTSSGAPFPSSTQSNNGTSVTASPNPGNNGTFPNAESIICPEYNDQVLQETDGSQYLIRCGLEIQGVVLLTRKARMVRRQATFGNDWIVDCIDSCSAMDTCVGTTYNSAQGSCTFYSTVDSLIANADTDSAILVNEAPAAVPVVSTQTVTEGEVTQTITTTPLTTSTVYSTTTRTIQSCAPGVPCSAATVTDVVVAYTTVCPASSVAGGAAAGAVTTKTVCTACQYAPTTVTVYQCPTAAAGAGKPVAVTTTVISVPVLQAPAMTTSTVYQTSEQVTTTCGANGCGKATVTAVVSLYTTVCPVSSGAAGSQASAPSAGSETVVVPGTTVPASTIPATVVNGSTKPAETVPASTKKPSTTIVQYTPTSSMVAYTGAAVKNGMGFAAMAAGVAALVL